MCFVIETDLRGILGARARPAKLRVSTAKIRERRVKGRSLSKFEMVAQISVARGAVSIRDVRGQNLESLVFAVTGGTGPFLVLLGVMDGALMAPVAGRVRNGHSVRPDQAGYRREGLIVTGGTVVV